MTDEGKAPEESESPVMEGLRRWAEHALRTGAMGAIRGTIAVEALGGGDAAALVQSAEVFEEAAKRLRAVAAKGEG